MTAPSPLDGAQEQAAPASRPVDLRRIGRLWSPLAASWLLMGTELPLFTIFVARLPNPEVQIAAYGSLAFAIALVVEGPIIQLLAASTALCGDRDSFCKVRRFMVAASVALTALHIAIAFTPLYDRVAHDLMQVPAELLAPGRWALQILTPWTAAIAYRRFHQGVLIRFESSRMVGVGTVIRLATLVGVLASGSALVHFGGLDIPGVVVGAGAVSAAVLAEAAFIGWVVRPVVRNRLAPDPPADERLGRKSFLRFYLPLALTPLMTLVIQPTGSAAMSRMPLAMASLAAWPVVHGLVFLVRSPGFALQEVVVALLREPGSAPALRRFTWLLGGATASILLLLALTPLSTLWFGHVSGLSSELQALCATGVLLAVAMPLYQCLQSWYSAVLVNARRTRAITEAVAIYVATAVLGLGAAARWSPWPGLYSAIAVFVCGGVLQTVWLAVRARPHLRRLRDRSAAIPEA